MDKNIPFKFMKIKTGFLVAYDYEMLKKAIPCIYNASDIICLCIDENRITWGGNKFNIEFSFFDWLNDFDIDKKIVVYEDKFYNANLSPMQMETAQRNKMAEYLGLDGWHIQLDVDEYFINFDQFVQVLKKIKSKSCFSFLLFQPS